MDKIVLEVDADVLFRHLVLNFAQLVPADLGENPGPLAKGARGTFRVTLHLWPVSQTVSGEWSVEKFDARRRSCSLKLRSAILSVQIDWRVVRVKSGCELQVQGIPTRPPLGTLAKRRRNSFVKQLEEFAASQQG